MAEPIVVTVFAAPDPNVSDKLLVSVDFPQVFLSSEDDDQVRWICQEGFVDVVFAPVNNPFDPNQSTGGQYQTQPDGSVISGSVDPNQLDPNPDAFRPFKYSILVTSFDGTRSGSRDPRVMIRKRRVYYFQSEQ